MRGLQGKNVLVTGGSSGIGQAIAVRFAEYGANVAINYLTTPDEAADTDEQVHACLSKVQQEGVQDVLVQGDVSKEDDVVRMVAETVDALGSIDILVNNAGIQISRPSHELMNDDFDRVIDVNLRGSFMCAPYPPPQAPTSSPASSENVQRSSEQSRSPCDAAASRLRRSSPPGPPIMTLPAATEEEVASPARATSPGRFSSPSRGGLDW